MQLELTENSKSLLTVNTEKGLWQYQRLPFGVSTAPGIFQNVMDQVLNGLEGVCCYLDDILISSPDEVSHMKMLDEVLGRLARHNIKANRAKCVFKVTSLEYLGHVIDIEGLRPTEDKVKAIRSAPEPQNVNELRSFIGLITYYCKFICQMANKCAPLYNLLKDGVKWNWDDSCKEAFKLLKDDITNDNVLVHYDPKAKLTLACDASPVGLGAVLSIVKDGKEHPVAFASRTLTSAEKNYAQIEREALAIIFGVTKFNQYLWGRQFELITDNQALVTIFGPKKGIPSLAAARLQRWALILMAHTYDVKFRKSSENANADMLSRLPVEDPEYLATELPINYFSVTDELPISADDIGKATKVDSTLCKVLQYVKNGWPKHVEDGLQSYLLKRNELSIDKGCLLWGERVIIPLKFRERILEELHQEHTGIVRMKAMARSYFWFPGMDKQIESVGNSCQICASIRSDPPKMSFMKWQMTNKPWERVHIDFFELEGVHYLLMVDSYSKWLNVEMMTNTNSCKTINVLRNWFAMFGIPVELVSDNGPQFRSEEFELFLTRNGIQHTLVAPYHPASNGAAERSVQICKKALKKYLIESLQGGGKKVLLNVRLNNFLLSYRVTPQTVTGQSPYDMVFRHAPRIRFTLLNPKALSHKKQVVTASKVEHLREFDIGQHVGVRNNRGGLIKYIKGCIIKRLGPLTYLVRVAGSIRYCHADHLLASVPVPDVHVGHTPRVVQEKERDPPVLTDSEPLPTQRTPPPESPRVIETPRVIEPVDEGQLIIPPEKTPLRRSARVVKAPDRLNL